MSKPSVHHSYIASIQKILSGIFAKREFLGEIFSRVIEYGIYITVFLIPIFFLPNTLVSTDFGKYSFIIIISSLLFILFFLKVVVARKIAIRYSLILIVLAVFVFISGVSVFFSVNRYISLWGEVRKYSGAFSYLFSLFVFLFLVQSEFSERKKLERLLFSFAVSSGLGMCLSYISLFFPNFYLSFGRNFANLFSAKLSDEAVFFSVFIVIFFVLVHSSRRYIQWIGAGLLILALFLENAFQFQRIWAGICVGVVFSAILIWYVREDEKVFSLSTIAKFRLGKLKKMRLSSSIAAFVILFSLLSFFLSIPKFLPGVIPPDRSLSERVGFSISRNVLAEHPLFGVGPDNFVYAFGKYKPVSFNENDLIWMNRFNRSSSEFNQILTTLGIFGFASFLLFNIVLFYIILRALTKTDDEFLKNILIACFGAIVTMLSLAWFFPFGVVSYFLYWFLVLVVFVVLNIITKQGFVFSKGIAIPVKLSLVSVSSLCILLLLVASVCYFSVTVGLHTVSEMFFFKGTEYAGMGRDDEAIQYFQKSVNLNPGRVDYHLALTSSYVSKFRSIPDEEAARKGEQAKLALENAKKTTELLPQYVKSWQGLGQLYEILRPYVKGIEPYVIVSYEKAFEREPTNPLLPYLIGKAYLYKAAKIAGLSEIDSETVSKIPDEAKADLKKASEYFQKSLALKKNYQEAAFSLSKTYELSQDLRKACETIDASIDEKFFSEDLSPDTVVWEKKDIDMLFSAGRLYYNVAVKEKDSDALNRAKKYFEIVVKLVPNHSNSLYALALIFEQEKNYPKALEYMERVEKLNPEKESLKKKIAEYREKL